MNEMCPYCGIKQFDCPFQKYINKPKISNISDFWVVRRYLDYWLF